MAVRNLAKKIMPRNNPVIFIIIILFLAASIISYIAPVTGDACWHVAAGKYIGQAYKIPFDEHIGRDELFYPPFLFHLIVALFEVFLKISSINLIFLVLPLAYAGSLFFTYLLIKDFLDKRAVLITILFLAFFPVFLTYHTNYSLIGVLTFFITASVYFTKKNKVLLGGLFFGLAIFTKFNGFMILPCLIYLLYKNNRLDYKPYLKFGITGLIGIIPYIRSYILFKNPIWPFLNPVFGGIETGSMTAAKSLSMDFSLLNTAKTVMFQFLGVPVTVESTVNIIKDTLNVNITNLIYIYSVIAIFIIFIPIVIGIYRLKNNRNFLILWIVGFFPLQIAYLININFTHIRFCVPFIPALAVFFGHGYSLLMKKYKKHAKILVIAFIMLCVCFFSIVIAKTIISKTAWDRYADDFDFIKKNSPKGTLIYNGGQCFSVRTDNRPVARIPENISDIKKGSLIFLNDDFSVETEIQIDKSRQEEVIRTANCSIIYDNINTHTRICKT